MYRRFITELAKDIVVDFGSQEIKEICNAVADLSSSLLDIVQDHVPFFKSSKIKLGGSMSEETRIWRFTEDDKTLMLEFDFLSVLENFHPKAFDFSKVCQGFSCVKQNENIFPSEYVNNEEELGVTGTLNAKMITFMFKVEMMRAVNSLCTCLSCEIKDIGKGCIRIYDIRKTDHFSDVCASCNRFGKTGKLSIAIGYSNHPVEMDATLVFIWKRNVCQDTVYPCEKSRQSPQIDDEVIILVDFLPAIELVRVDMDIPSPGREYHLVPKGCKNEHNTCWKISHSTTESLLMKATSMDHRKTYVALKFILDYISCEMKGFVDTPKTYILKTAVLYHMQVCKTGGKEFSTCVLDVMTFLSNAYSVGYLPHYFEMFNILQKVSDSTLPPEDETWFKHRNRVLAECWNTIRDICEDIEQIVPADYDFDKIQTVLKMITVVFGRCWTQTDFRDIYLPNKPYLRSILKRFVFEDYPTKSEMECIVQKIYMHKSQRFQGRNLPLYLMSLYRSGRTSDASTAEFFHGMTESEMLEYIEQEKSLSKTFSKRSLTNNDKKLEGKEQESFQTQDEVLSTAKVRKESDLKEEEEEVLYRRM